MDEKREQFEGEDILKGEAVRFVNELRTTLLIVIAIQLKEFASKVRTKGSQFKKKKTEIAELRTESGIKTRTINVLHGHEKSLLDVLAKSEEARGISGYFSMQETRKQSADGPPPVIVVGESIEELTSTIRRLNR